MKEHNDNYHLAPIDLDNPKNTHDFQILLTGIGKEVLEIGPATGYLSKILKERKCVVTGIEINPEFAKKAKQILDDLYVGDIEKLDLKEVLGDKKFDVILLGDSLEHTKNPLQVLKKIKDFIRDNGSIVCSIPNISYIITRLKLLDGDFDYTDVGLLDKTHLRFFNLSSILELLEEAGYSLIELKKVKEEFYLAHRIDVKQWVIPQELIDSILKDPESTTFQYILKANPTTKVDSAVRKYVNKFPRNIVTEELKAHFEFLKEQIDVLQQIIKDKDDFLNKVIKDKDDFLNKVIKDKDAQINEIKNSTVWKILKKLDKIRGKTR